MGHVILQEFVTLDGFAAGPNDSVDFVPASTVGDQSFGQRQMGFIDSIDTILLGRVTYKMFAEYWPKVTSGEDKPFADKFERDPEDRFLRNAESCSVGQMGRCNDCQEKRGEGSCEVEATVRQESKCLTTTRRHLTLHSSRRRFAAPLCSRVRRRWMPCVESRRRI